MDNWIGCSGQLHHVAERIEPNAFLDKRVYIIARRAGSTAVQCQCMWNDSGAASSFSINMDAAPSLTVDWSVSPSYEDSSEYIVSVDVASNNPSVTPAIQQVGGWSRRVELGKSIDGFDVGRRGVAHLVIKTTDDERGGADVKHSTARGGGAGGGGGGGGLMKASLVVIRNFLILEKTNMIMKVKIEEHRKKKLEEAAAGGGIVKSIQEIRRDANLAKSKMDGTFNGEVEKDRVGSIASVSSRVDCSADLYAAYTYEGSDAVASFVWKSVQVRPKADTAIQGCPLLVTADYKGTVEFGGGEEVVAVQLKNRHFGLGGEHVDFVFEVGSIPGVEINGPQSFKSSLKPGESMAVPLRALYLQRGVFNLQNVRITVQVGDRSIPFLFPFHWCITVK